MQIKTAAVLDAFFNNCRCSLQQRFIELKTKPVSLFGGIVFDALIEKHNGWLKIGRFVHLSSEPQYASKLFIGSSLLKSPHFRFIHNMATGLQSSQVKFECFAS